MTVRRHVMYAEMMQARARVRINRILLDREYSAYCTSARSTQCPASIPALISVNPPAPGNEGFLPRHDDSCRLSRGGGGAGKKFVAWSRRWSSPTTIRGGRLLSYNFFDEDDSRSMFHELPPARRKGLRPPRSESREPLTLPACLPRTTPFLPFPTGENWKFHGNLLRRACREILFASLPLLSLSIYIYT